MCIEGTSFRTEQSTCLPDSSDSAAVSAPVAASAVAAAASQLQEQQG